jgi:tRNA G46 methylase TrmB
MSNYNNYTDYKNWKEESFMEYDSYLDGYFRKELESFIKRDGSFLEIGFGNGSLLGWASSKY